MKNNNKHRLAPHTSLRATFRLTPLVALIAALFAPSVHADSFTIVGGETSTLSRTLSDYETGIIQAGGTLSTFITTIRAFGINNTVINSGTISLDGGAVDSYGIYSWGDNATITNNGTISATNVMYTGGGIYSSGNHAAITNSGTISTSGVWMFGIDSSGTDATITNSGSISTTGHGGHGIRSSGSNTTITNSGSITTTGSGSFGIHSWGDNATITNSGSINVTGASAVGICIDASSGNSTTINLSGSVLATGDATHAIASGTGDETLNLYSGTRIIGTVDLGAGTNVVNVITNSGGPSSTMTITNAGTITQSGSGLSLVNASTGTVAMVDTTNLTASQASLGTLSANVFQNINQQLNRTPALHRPAQVASNGSDAGLWANDTAPMGWGQVFGKYTKHGSDGAALAFQDRTYGVIGGYEQRVGDYRAGVFGGAAQSNMDTSSSSAKTDSNSVFAGLYGQVAKENWRFNGALALGYANYNSDRQVIDNLYGTETASADYHGWYVSPSVSVTRIFDQGAGFSLRPSVELNYTYGRMGSYDESGTTRSNLSVGSRTAQVLNTRLQLAARQELADKKGDYEWRGGISHTRYGDDDTSISLQSVGTMRYSMTGTGNVTGAYVGLNTRLHYKNNLDFVGDVELFHSGDTDRSIMAYAGLEYRF